MINTTEDSIKVTLLPYLSPDELNMLVPFLAQKEDNVRMSAVESMLMESDERSAKLPVFISGLTNSFPIIRQKLPSLLRRGALAISHIANAAQLTEDVEIPEKLQSLIFSHCMLFEELMKSINAKDLTTRVQRAVICAILDLAQLTKRSSKLIANMVNSEVSIKSAFEDAASSLAYSYSYPAQSLLFEFVFRVWRAQQKQNPSLATQIEQWVGHQIACGFKSISMEFFEENVRAVLNASNCATNPYLVAYPVHSIYLVKDYLPSGYEIMLGNSRWLDVGPKCMTLYVSHPESGKIGLATFEFEDRNCFGALEILDRAMSLRFETSWQLGGLFNILEPGSVILNDVSKPNFAKIRIALNTDIDQFSNLRKQLVLNVSPNARGKCDQSSSRLSTMVVHQTEKLVNGEATTSSGATKNSLICENEKSMKLIDSNVDSNQCAEEMNLTPLSLTQAQTNLPMLEYSQTPPRCLPNESIEESRSNANNPLSLAQDDKINPFNHPPDLESKSEGKSCAATLPQNPSKPAEKDTNNTELISEHNFSDTGINTVHCKKLQVPVSSSNSTGAFASVVDKPTPDADAGGGGGPSVTFLSLPDEPKKYSKHNLKVFSDKSGTEATGKINDKEDKVKKKKVTSARRLKKIEGPWLRTRSATDNTPEVEKLARKSPLITPLMPTTAPTKRPSEVYGAPKKIQKLNNERLREELFASRKKAAASLSTQKGASNAVWDIVSDVGDEDIEEDYRPGADMSSSKVAQYYRSKFTSPSKKKSTLPIKSKAVFSRVEGGKMGILGPITAAIVKHKEKKNLVSSAPPKLPTKIEKQEKSNIVSKKLEVLKLPKSNATLQRDSSPEILEKESEDECPVENSSVISQENDSQTGNDDQDPGDAFNTDEEVTPVSPICSPMRQEIQAPTVEKSAPKGRKRAVEPPLSLDLSCQEYDEHDRSEGEAEELKSEEGSYYENKEESGEESDEGGIAILVRELAQRHLDSQMRKKRRRIEEAISEGKNTALNFVNQVGDSLSQYWEEGVADIITRANTAAINIDRLLAEADNEHRDCAEQQTAIIKKLAETSMKFDQLQKKAHALPSKWARGTGAFEAKISKMGNDAAAKLQRTVNAGRKKEGQNGGNKAASLGKLLHAIQHQT